MMENLGANFQDLRICDINSGDGLGVMLHYHHRIIPLPWHHVSPGKNGLLLLGRRTAVTAVPLSYRGHWWSPPPHSYTYLEKGVMSPRGSHVSSHMMITWHGSHDGHVPITWPHDSHMIVTWYSLAIAVLFKASFAGHTIFNKVNTERPWDKLKLAQALAGTPTMLLQLWCEYLSSVYMYLNGIRHGQWSCLFSA